jgi:hypothetical protein
MGIAVRIVAPPVDEEEPEEPMPFAPVGCAAPVTEAIIVLEDSVRLAAACADLRVWLMKFAQATAAVLWSA